MPIYRLLQNKGFDPQQVKCMTEAFEIALRTLGLTDRYDPLVEHVAKRIVHTAQTGEHDASRIAAQALKDLAPGD